MKNVEKKNNIILDLDQTLLSAEPTDGFSKNDKYKNLTRYNMDGYYYVFERPYLQDFLTFIFDNFNVSIWTAATKDYALYIIDNIILKNNPSRKLDYVFYCYHGGISERQNEKGGSKNLSTLWNVFKMPGYNRENTFILDDYDEVYETQPNNTIIAKPFEYKDANCEKDDFLKRLILELQKINSAKNIQDHIEKINFSLSGKSISLKTKLIKI